MVRGTTIDADPTAKAELNLPTRGVDAESRTGRPTPPLTQQKTQPTMRGTDHEQSEGEEHESSGQWAVGSGK